MRMFKASSTMALVTISFLSFLSPAWAQPGTPQALPSGFPHTPAPSDGRVSPKLSPGIHNLGGPFVQLSKSPTPTPIPTPVPLNGWVDLHTHPMTNIAFGGKLFQGAPDVGVLLPQDLSCNYPVKATTVAQALEDDRPTHGGWDVHFQCGDDFRVLLMGVLQNQNNALVTAGTGKPPAIGYPTFDIWPAWNDITHEKMWWDWIRRAHDGGLRVMVALAVNNRTLGDAVAYNGGAFPTDDLSTADRQLTEIKTLVNQHADFMKVALTSGDLKQIVQANKIAVVLGVEIDNIGNLNLLPAGAVNATVISTTIQHLYDEGVRYIFPIHVVDNVFGGTAVYEPIFDLANFRDTGACPGCTGHWWDVGCASTSDGADWQLDGNVPLLSQVQDFANVLGIDAVPPRPPTCPQHIGHRNKLPLLPLGTVAIKEMMKRGMIIDIDHMSDLAANGTLKIAESIPGGYPIVSGHSGVRGDGQNNKENSRSTDQLMRIANLGGMFGLGTNAVSAREWSSSYQIAMKAMGYRGGDPSQKVYDKGMIAFGTDTNGLVRSPRPPGVNVISYNDASFPMSSMVTTLSDGSSFTKRWNYNSFGVAHYGMFWDFIVDVRTQPAASLGEYASGEPYGVNGGVLVDEHLMRSANHFWKMWAKAEAQKINVTAGSPTPTFPPLSEHDKCVNECSAKYVCEGRDGSAQQTACLNNLSNCLKNCPH